MEFAYTFARKKALSAEARQKRNYDIRATSRHFNIMERSDSVIRGRTGDPDWTVTGLGPVRFWNTWERWYNNKPRGYGRLPFIVTD